MLAFSQFATVPFTLKWALEKSCQNCKIHGGNRCRELCPCVHGNGYRLLCGHMELHKNAHRRSRSRNSKLPFWLHRKEFRGEEDHCVALSTFSLCFVLHKLKRLITDLHVLHSDDLKNSSALIYGADHIFHKLQMTTSSHVLVNKSHRF